ETLARPDHYPRPVDHPDASSFGQAEHRLRFGWGPNGLRLLAPEAAVVVIVDVLSFSTSVDVAVGRGAVILPYRWHDGSEDAYAEANDAIVAARVPADGGAPAGYTLRPSSLTEIESGVRLVLPSPNGSALTFGAAEAGADTESTAAGDNTGDADNTTDATDRRGVLVGCLRNATAVGRAAATLAHRANGAVAVIAAGERWRGTTGPLRPAVEDLLGAGAILAAAADTLGPDQLSPEASAAAAAHRDAAPVLGDRLRACGSGRQLIDRSFPADVELAAEADVSRSVPTLSGAELIDAGSSLDRDRAAED
ncbi:MAG: 2-phosphosulfolactate phosphatase, partial [Actinomycetota bacterium]